MARTPYEDSRWPKLAAEIIERDGGRCQIRGPRCKGKATQCDHIIPWRDGGSWFDPANLRGACEWCNTWRAQRQKSRDGWKRSGTRVHLVMGPPGACDKMSHHVAANAGPRDIVIDYRAIALAIGNRVEEVRKVRGSLITKVRRGDVDAPAAWITSTNPRARTMFPYHELVVVDPGRAYALAHVHAGGAALVDEWYRFTAVAGDDGAKEWEW